MVVTGIASGASGGVSSPPSVAALQSLIDSLPPHTQQVVAGEVALLLGAPLQKVQDVRALEDPSQEVTHFNRFTPDGTRLDTVSNGRESGIRVWDLRAIRRGLKELDLDWDTPDYPPEPPVVHAPLRIEVVPKG
jgi:hypothetical protein